MCECGLRDVKFVSNALDLKCSKFCVGRASVSRTLTATVVPEGTVAEGALSEM